MNYYTLWVFFYFVQGTNIKAYIFMQSFFKSSISATLIVRSCVCSHICEVCVYIYTYPVVGFYRL